MIWSVTLIRLIQILMQILNRLIRLTKLMNLTRLRILINQIIFTKLMNSWDRLLWAVLLKMLMKQIAEYKALSARLTNFYIWDKNINMISKIIFRIRLRLFWLLLIRAEVLIILSLIWADIIDIFIIKIKIFHNMIWSDRVEWLWLIFSNSFVLILIMMKVDFLSEVWINWLWLWCSCCASNDHQRLLWSWQS